MRRNAPLRRTSPLGRTAGLARTRGPARTSSLGRGGGQLARSAPPKRKPKPKRSPEEDALALAWMIAVTKNRRARCARCGSRKSIQGHHVIDQQMLERRAREKGVAAALLLWDVRGGMACCERCHSRHTTATDRLPRSLLTAANWAFINELELAWWVETRYPSVTPPEAAGGRPTCRT